MTDRLDGKPVFGQPPGRAAVQCWNVLGSRLPQPELQQVVADSSGAATVTSNVAADYSIPAGGWYVNVHHGPDFSAPANGPSISCGDLAPA